MVEALRAYVKLLRAAKAVVARLEPGLANAGLTLTQLGVLEAVLHKGPLTQRELGRKVLTSAGNMTDVIDKLERRGMVSRSRKPGDRRAVRVELTPEGQRRIEAIFPPHAGKIAAAMSGLSPAELAQLGELLRKLGMAAAEPEPLAQTPGAH
ncbi:MAG TPA: MarR family transcriptional regulator [Acetobacteraceae bacterium]